VVVTSWPCCSEDGQEPQPCRVKVEEKVQQVRLVTLDPARRGLGSDSIMGMCELRETGRSGRFESLLVLLRSIRDCARVRETHVKLPNSSNPSTASRTRWGLLGNLIHHGFGAHATIAMA